MQGCTLCLDLRARPTSRDLSLRCVHAMTVGHELTLDRSRSGRTEMKDMQRVVRGKDCKIFRLSCVDERLRYGLLSCGESP